MIKSFSHVLTLDSSDGRTSVSTCICGTFNGEYGFRQTITNFGIIAHVCTMLPSCLKCSYLQSSILRDIDVYIYIYIYVRICVCCRYAEKFFLTFWCEEHVVHFDWSNRQMSSFVVCFLMNVSISGRNSVLYS